MTEGDVDATGHNRPGGGHGRPAAGQVAALDRPTAGHAEPSYLPLAEVAALKGMHPEALRSLVRRDQVPARRDNRGKWLVAVPTGHQERQPASDRSVTGQDDRLPISQDEGLAELQNEVGELRTELARVRARLGAAEDVARAGIEAAQRVAEAQITARDLVNAELRRELEWHRRPWWRRLVG